jgi:molybdate/tungstate transport system substrate-binding protein
MGHRALLTLGAVLVATGCKAPAEKRPLVVFNAAALGPPLKAVLDSAARKGIIAGVAQENSPSLTAVRKLTDLGRTPDILATADISLFDSLIVPKYAQWYIVFGTNALVLAYSDRSRLASQAPDIAWPDLLLREGVRVGRSDPRIDPSGYRALMALQLAEAWYKRPGLRDSLLAVMPDRYVRHAEADLSALVQAGELDYGWTYRNLAKAHGLKWVELPAEISMESPALADWYSQATVSLPGTANQPALTLRGAPIAFALAIPAGAPSADRARRFVEFLLGADGRRIMEATGFSVLAKPWGVGPVPAELKTLLE